MDQPDPVDSVDVTFEQPDASDEVGVDVLLMFLYVFVLRIATTLKLQILPRLEQCHTPATFFGMGKVNS